MGAWRKPASRFTGSRPARLRSRELSLRRPSPRFRKPGIPTLSGAPITHDEPMKKYSDGSVVLGLNLSGGAARS